jgi:hypothetical protein
MLTGLIRSDVLQPWGAAFAIVLLPLAGFYADRQFDEPITGFIGPALLALYALGLVAYAAVSSGRMPRPLASAAVGMLGVGTIVSGFMGLLGILAALFTLLLLPLARAHPSIHMQFIALVLGMMLVASVLSPWLTAAALGHVTWRTWKSHASHLGKARTIAWVALGACLIVAAMVTAQRVHANWLAPRLQAFDTDDMARWEQSLRDIRTNWFCGRRRCLMPVCNKLTSRFGRGAGETGFAPILGFGVEAPRVPANLAGPFNEVYGRPVTQVCAVGD